MFFFDAHLDMAWNALDWNRNISRPVAEIREFEQHLGEFRRGQNTVSWPDLRRGKIVTIVATLLPRLHRKPSVMTFFQSREAAYGACRGQLAYYEILVEQGELRFIKTAADLQKHLAEWRAWGEDTTAAGAPPLGFILSMEGSWAVLRPTQIEEWYDRGLRLLGPAHYGPDPYCHGTGSEGGLKADGPALLREMSRVGMMLDATHLADQSFWEALDIYEGPIIASHHNCRALVPGDRQLTDEQIKALIARGAVIGAAFDSWMLKPGWIRDVTDPSCVTLDAVADHIDHVCQLAGNTNHSGIGTDLDGGFGREQSPHDLDTIADLYKVMDILSRRGYADADLKKISHENFQNFFLKNLPK